MLLKTGPCFTEELELNCPTIVACVTALPTGPAAVVGDLLLGPDGRYHALPAAPAQVPQELTLAGQILALSNGGGSVVLPDSDDQTLTLVGNDLSISGGNTVTLPSAPGQVAQVLSIAGNTVSLSGGGGSVTVPDDQQLSIAGNVISLTDGGSVTLPAAAAPTLSISGQDLTISGGNTITLPPATVAFATPAETIAGTSTTLAVNPADLYARENIPAQTGLGLVLSAIPAPTASQSVWGTNTLGETLHYSPGLGWKIVADHFKLDQTHANPALPNSVFTTLYTYTVPRAGRILASGTFDATNDQYPSKIRLLMRKNTGSYTVNSGTSGGTNDGVGMNVTDTYDVVAGDTISFFALPGGAPVVYTAYNVTTSFTYLN